MEELETLLARLRASAPQETDTPKTERRALDRPAAFSLAGDFPPAGNFSPAGGFPLSPGEGALPGGIGTLGEKQLHAALKRHYSSPGALLEVPLEGYVADIVGERGIIEIQTRGLGRLRKKLEKFLARAPVTVVYPIPRHKWLCWIDPATGEIGPRRKSPKTGTPYHAFPELYGLKPLLTHPGLHIRLVLLDLEEYRFLDGRGRDKKKGSTKGDRVPLSLVQEICLDSPADYAQLLPASLPSPFTSKDYASAAHISRPASQTALNVLYAVGAVERVGKQGQFYLYRRK